jgi:microcin C transport system permease protein
LLGTNTQGADILAYLYGGLQVNIKAAIFYLPLVYLIGISFGMLMGYFGGKFDITVQRLIEIFSQVPFLFIIMIISDMVPLNMKGMFLIVGLLIMFGWMGMTYQLRTSTMKEKSRDYVSAARVLGASTSRILFIHILPNLVAILVTLVPFSVSALILALASLDYLGFGLPDNYASWGRLLNDGLSNLSAPWVVTAAFTALVVILLLVTFIGEAVREAFDPKKFTTYK